MTQANMFEGHLASIIRNGEELGDDLKFIMNLGQFMVHKASVHELKNHHKFP